MKLKLLSKNPLATHSKMAKIILKNTAYQMTIAVSKLQMKTNLKYNAFTAKITLKILQNVLFAYVEKFIAADFAETKIKIINAKVNSVLIAKNF